VSQVLRLTAMLLRAYARDRVALFFSLFVPLMLMVLFGYLNLGAFGRVSAVVDDQARNADSERFISALRGVETIRIELGSETEALRELRRTELDMLLVIPPDFRLARADRGAPPPATVTLFGNEARQQQVAAGTALVSEVVNRLSFAVAGTGPAVAIDRRSVAGVRLRYVDFLVPGILGMNLMQLAVFGVAFGLVVEKQRGVLRRIMATPIRPRRFLAAHVIMRLVLAVAQVLVLLATAALLFNVRIVGSVLDLLAVAIVGSVLFLTQGFAIAGWAQTENQVPAVAQLITLPQFFLSGVFFPKEAAPAVIRPITEVLPLTYLNDALREISVQGASLWDVRDDVLGLLVWTVVGFVLAVRLFRFDKA
jgi:ABC-2 type transport system permease protein